MRAIAGGVALLSLLVGTWAGAQEEPPFSHPAAGAPPKEESPPVEWKAQAKLGGLFTTGNSSSTTLSSGVALSRKANGNKIAFEGGIAYARASVLGDANKNGVIDVYPDGGPETIEQTTSNAWFSKARYDRFLTEHNAAYVLVGSGGDTPAGKDFVFDAQIGYSRQVYKSDRHEAVAELGYDAAYENYATEPDTSVTVHSARVFLGETAKLNKETGVFASLETLVNLNEESDMMMLVAERFHDARVNAKTGITTTLWKNLSFSFSVAAKYDNVPAPRPAPKGFSFAGGAKPLADKLDTLTEVALVVNFL